MAHRPGLDHSSQPSVRRRLDLAGIGVAGLCAIHCVATILFVSGLGIGGHFLLDPHIHEFALVFAILIAGIALGWGFARHRRKGPFVIAAAGIGFMMFALAVGHSIEEAVLTFIGVALVAAGHLANLRSIAIGN